MMYCDVPTGFSLMKAGTWNVSCCCAILRPPLILFDLSSRARQHKRLGKELVFRQAALAREVGARLADHQRIAAGIDLKIREVRHVFEHGAMDKTFAAGPGGLGRGENGDEIEPWQLACPFLRKLAHIEVLRASAAPVEFNPPRAFAPDQIFDDRFDRREARARRNAYDRAIGILAQEEIAKGEFDLHPVAHLQLFE